MSFSVMGTGLLPSSLESIRLGISEDDRRKTRNALKAIRKARRQGRKVNFVRPQDSSPPGVTHAAGRGDLNDRNTVNSEAAAVAETRP
jgi:hypothetical protein